MNCIPTNGSQDDNTRSNGQRRVKYEKDEIEEETGKIRASCCVFGDHVHVDEEVNDGHGDGYEQDENSHDYGKGKGHNVEDLVCLFGNGVQKQGCFPTMTLFELTLQYLQ